MKKIIATGLILATMAQSVSFANHGETAGTVGGAGLGGLIGNILGDGDPLATVLGAVAGAVIGNQLGQQLDRADRTALGEAHREALNGQINRRYSWDGYNRGSRTRAYGEIVVLREGRRSRSSEVCREYQSVITIGRKQEVNKGYACRRSDGSWIEVKEQEVSFNGVIVESNREVEVINGQNKRRKHRRNNYGEYNNYNDNYSRQERPQQYQEQRLSDIEQREQYQAAYRFAYNTNGLNLDDSTAKAIAYEWMNRNYCEDARGINQLWEAYKGHYNFAYSSSGMNMDSQGAKRFAINKLRTHSRCADLLR